MRLLNISGLNLKVLNAIKLLPHLTELIAADNHFEDSNTIVSSIVQLQRLRSATFTNCPANKNDIYYRNKIILASKSLGSLYPTSFNLTISNYLLVVTLFSFFPIIELFNLLELLDNKQINGVTRLFLKNFDKVKSEQKLQKQQKLYTNNVAYEPSGATNNTVDIDLRDNDQTTERSDPIGIDVTNIISQAIVENVQCKPWIMFGEYTFLTEYIGALPKPTHDQK